MTGPQSVEGLITRLGRWLDRRFQAKATQEELRYYFNAQENASIKDKIELMEKIEEVKTQADVWVDTLAALTQARFDFTKELDKVRTDIQMIIEARGNDRAEKDLADLKTRMEKMELYAGMTRKVDPTKPPVVKSAFQM